MKEIRIATETDFPAILRLNDAEVQQTSPMSLATLTSLVRMSAYSKVATEDGHVAAFLIAIRDGAAYENANYRWFSSRIASFLYVDRVVVGSKFKGRKLGSNLYSDLFTFACLGGIPKITCEYNIDPPNPASRAFHEKFGFAEVGTQWVAGGTKEVTLQEASTQAVIKQYMPE